VSLERCKATVVRRVYYQNSSLILSFLSREYGIVDTIAKGCRKEKSPLFGNLDYLNSGELIFYSKNSGSLHIVSQFDPESVRTPIKSDPVKYAAASVMCDMIYAGCASDNPAPEIFDVFEEALVFLEKKDDFVKILTVFALNYVKFLGLSPLLDACAGCGCDFSAQDCYISFVKGGLLCDNCRKGSNYTEFSLSALNSIRYLSRSGYELSSRLNMGRKQARECLVFIISLIQTQFDRKIKSSAFLFNLLD
jgi:DNA repair protein RecO (recombination protein O)